VRLPRYLIKVKGKHIDSIKIPKGTKLRKTSKGYVATLGKRKSKPLKGFRVINAKNERNAWQRVIGKDSTFTVKHHKHYGG